MVQTGAGMVPSYLRPVDPHEVMLANIADQGTLAAKVGEQHETELANANAVASSSKPRLPMMRRAFSKPVRLNCRVMMTNLLPESKT